MQIDLEKQIQIQKIIDTNTKITSKQMSAVKIGSDPEMKQKM